MRQIEKTYEPQRPLEEAFEFRSFQLLSEDKSHFGSGYTLGSKVYVTIGAHGKERELDSLEDVITLPGVSIFQWLPYWADGFENTEPYSEIPEALAKRLTKRERTVYAILRRNREEYIHKDLLIKFGLGRMPTDKMRKKLVYHICNLRKKLTDEGIECKRGNYKLYKKV